MSEILQATFGIGDVVRPTEESTLFSLFPDEKGEVVERRYSLENSRWMCMVTFEFGTFPFPEHELRKD